MPVRIRTAVVVLLCAVPLGIVLILVAHARGPVRDRLPVPSPPRPPESCSVADTTGVHVSVGP